MALNNFIIFSSNYHLFQRFFDAYFWFWIYLFLEKEDLLV